LAEAGDNPHDQTEENKNITFKNRRQPITDAETNEDGEDQDHADGTGPVTSFQQVLEKIFGFFFQMLPCPIAGPEKMILFTCAYLSYPRKLVNHFCHPMGRKIA
jgi:hypothetical protein